MHPDIRKFWEDAGYVISEPGYIDSMGSRIQMGTITGYKALSPNPCICLIEVIAFGDKHRINGQWYSEEEMLKIIKLKAFI